MRGEKPYITITGNDATTLRLMLEILSHINKLRGDLKNRADSPTFSFTGLALFTHACSADSIKKNKIELLKQLFNNLLKNIRTEKPKADNKEVFNGNTETLYERYVALPFQKEEANPLNKLKSYLEQKSTETLATLATLTTLTTPTSTDLGTMIASLTKLKSELKKTAPDIKIINDEVKELRRLQKRDSITIHTRNPENPFHTYFIVTYPFSKHFGGDDKLKFTRQYESCLGLIKTYQTISQGQEHIASSPFLPHSYSSDSLAEETSLNDKTSPKEVELTSRTATPSPT